MLSGHFDEGLIDVVGVVDILLQFQESFEGGAEELRVSESVANILVFFFCFGGDIILVSFSVVMVASDRAVESFPFPFDDVFELLFRMPDGLGSESVLVGEGPCHLLVNISSGESNIGELVWGDSVGVEVGVDSRDAFFVGPIEFGDGVPDLSLKTHVKFELLNDSIVLSYFGLIVVLIEFVVDVVGRVGILVGKKRVLLVVSVGVVFKRLQVVLFLCGGEKPEGIGGLLTKSEDILGQSSC